MRALRAVSLAVLSLSLAGTTRAQELPAALQAPFAAGVEALKAGRLDAAAAAFEGVLEQGGRLAFVHHNLGLVYQQRDQADRAAAQFREALRLDPGFAPPRLALGATLLTLGRVKEATPELERAVTLLPKEPLARSQLAQAYEHAGRWTDAVEQYRALRERFPREAEYAYRLGRAYLRVGEWSLRRLREEDPDSARLHQALGHNYRVQGRPDLALRAFERAARADPRLAEVHLSLAQIHLEQGSLADARREVERELALVPESAGARALLERLRAEEAKAR